MKTKINRRRLLATGAAAGTALAAPALVSAAPVTLSMSSWLPPNSEIPPNFMDIWREDVAALTGGRVRIDVLPKPLGPPPKHLGLVEGGQADVAYSLHGYTPDRFLRARVGQFSFLGDSFSVSQAFSRVYRKILNAEEEHSGMELLAVFQHGPGMLMLKNRRIAGPEDFRGLRIRTSGGYIGALLEDLGAVNKPMSPFAVADALRAGEIDGVAFPYEGAPAFKVVEEITSVSELPGGYYNATWFMGMSKQAAARLEPRDLAAIKDYSRDTAHVLAAKAFDFADFNGKEIMTAAGVEILPTGADVIGAVRRAAQGYEDRWHQALSQQGYDGRFALELTRELTGQG